MSSWYKGSSLNSADIACSVWGLYTACKLTRTYCLCRWVTDCRFRTMPINWPNTRFWTVQDCKMLASAKLIREVKFTYSVVVAKGKGHGNFFSRLDEQFTLAPTPLDSGKNCFSHEHSFGQGVMIWLVHNAPKTRITNATIRELIIIEENALVVVFCHEAL